VIVPGEHSPPAAPPAEPALRPEPSERSTAVAPRVRNPAWVWARRTLAVLVIGFAAGAAYNRRGDLAQASRMLGHLRVGWLAVAIALEAGSMVVLARLQRHLLRAGGVRIRLRPMVEITLAGNALGTSLPGGVAWAATWAYGQLRRRGADRLLAGWVILTAGALGSFALFVMVAAGSWLAGSRGPVAHLRWLTAALAAIPLAAALTALAGRRSRRVRRVFAALWALCLQRLPGAHLMARVADRMRYVQTTPRVWATAFGLALANWVDDAACMAACILALGLHVPWRGFLVVYSLTQISASLPVTPGGLGVVEGSMTALLVAYGMTGGAALASVLLYRIVSYWGLVPIGWGAWLALATPAGLVKRPRGGLRPTRPARSGH
jgi:uncharacterized membrane protein YbhN (UPF0104 family)